MERYSLFPLLGSFLALFVVVWVSCWILDTMLGPFSLCFHFPFTFWFWKYMSRLLLLLFFLPWCRLRSFELMLKFELFRFYFSWILYVVSVSGMVRYGCRLILWTILAARMWMLWLYAILVLYINSLNTLGRVTLSLSLSPFLLLFFLSFCSDDLYFHVKWILIIYLRIV